MFRANFVKLGPINWTLDEGDPKIDISHRKLKIYFSDDHCFLYNIGFGM